ncbi:hypothetical protein O6H91_11G050500 [Diphasiastrum complanatum]|uniref:Uncharacterized protein n=1 Tax=Diphasiastrum complanatum TaxID=34168 RepID=A0ACC2C944_DIPCM|nr:hypothetical protein O6H91_11G050500 [Diphasiastrum complanatum]
MAHWQMAKRILQYLKGTQKMRFTYKADNERKGFELHHYSDASWASCKDDNKSVTRGCSIACGSSINWICKKQTLVAQSSCQTEINGLMVVQSIIGKGTLM